LGEKTQIEQLILYIRLRCHQKLDSLGGELEFLEEIFTWNQKGAVFKQSSAVRSWDLG